MLLGEMGFFEFVQANWVAIATAISAITTALATAAVYCIRAIWFHAARPLIEYLRDKFEDALSSHKSFLNGIDSKVGVIVDTQGEIRDQIRDQVGGRFELHKAAITHTADGLIAHADGNADEAKKLAAKAKEVVRS